MGINNADVYVGQADYGVSGTGAILVGDVITATNIPATISAALTAITNFTGLGYVSEDGVSLSTDYGTESVKEWNKAKIRTLLNEFTGTVSAVLVQSDYDGWCAVVGAENVTKTAATTTSGELIHVKIGAHLPARKAFAVKMKDGDAAMLLLIPNGQVASGLDITFQAGDVIRLPLEVDCLDDGTGESIHFYMNNGRKTSS